jgi:hypothetical protein
MKKYIITTLILSATKILFAQTTLTVQDTRAVANVPSSYTRTLQAHFKSTSVLGLPAGRFHTVLGLRGWADDTGGKAHELAFGDDSKIYLRSGLEATGWGGWRALLISNETGNFGIGTANPTDLLTVAGNIGAREIKVSTIAGADFVFEPSYKLPDLTELEKFVKTNKHLPEIPTAKQMIENGINLGELNVKLLQKVEELTLHLIEQRKQITDYQNIQQKQQLEIEKLKTLQNKK